MGLMLGNHGNTNFNMLDKVQRELPKLANKVDLDRIFLMDWKGHTYNIVPFMCASMSFYSEKDVQRKYVLKGIQEFIEKESITIVQDLKTGLYELLKENIDERDFAIFNILPRNPSPSKGSLSTMVYYLYLKDKKSFLINMLGVYSRLLGELVLNKRPFDYWSTNYKEYGNKEAFSYYIGLSWILKVEPKFKLYLGKFLKNLNLKDRYNEMCPEGCFLDKILTEEIETESIIDEYFNTDNFKDESNYYVRDIVLDATEGNYDGHDLNKEICDVIGYFNFVEKDYVYGESHLSYFISCFDRYENTNNFKSLEKDVELKDNEIERNKKSIEKQSKLIDKYSEQINTLQEENKQLRYELGNISTDEELKDVIEQLNTEIKELKQETCRYETTHLRDKQEISLLRKKVGKIESKVIQDKLDIYVSDEIVGEDDTVTIEQKIEVIKDKKIVLLGLEFLTPTVQRMEELGFSNITLCSKDTKKPGKFDVCVVLATRCMHDVVRRMETFAEKYNALWLYSASTNAEKIIDLIYEYSIEEEINE